VTVAELIEELMVLPQDAEVYVPDWEYVDGYEPRDPEPEFELVEGKVRL